MALLVDEHRLIIIVVHRFSCSVAYGLFPDQGSNLSLLHWQLLEPHWDSPMATDAEEPEDDEGRESWRHESHTPSPSPRAFIS